MKAIYRKKHKSKGSFKLMKDQIPYTADLGTENERQRNNNKLGFFNILTGSYIRQTQIKQEE